MKDKNLLLAINGCWQIIITPSYYDSNTSPFWTEIISLLNDTLMIGEILRHFAFMDRRGRYHKGDLYLLMLSALINCKLTPMYIIKIMSSNEHESNTR
jgi:hypothetical protein